MRVEPPKHCLLKKGANSPPDFCFPLSKSKLLLSIPNVHFPSWAGNLPFHHPLLFFSLFPSTEIHKNVISPLEGDAKEGELHKKHTDLKQKMRDLNHGFERLRKLSHEGFTKDNGEPGKISPS